MTKEKILEVVAFYKTECKKLGIRKKKYGEGLMPMNEHILAHCHAILDEIEGFVKEGRIEKAFRHLGFVQGCFWAEGMFTVEDLKSHNRP